MKDITLTADGTSGKDWITRLEKKGFYVSFYAKQILESEDFKPTTETYTVRILEGKDFPDEDRITDKVRTRAKELGLVTPSAEVACLLTETLTTKDIRDAGLSWVTVMHEPIEDSVGGPGLLYVCAVGTVPLLFASYGNPGFRWHRGSGFAFALASTSTLGTKASQTLSPTVVDKIDIRLGSIEYEVNELRKLLLL